MVELDWLVEVSSTCCLVNQHCHAWIIYLHLSSWLSSESAWKVPDRYPEGHKTVLSSLIAVTTLFWVAEILSEFYIV